MNTTELKSDIHLLVEEVNDIDFLNAIKTILRTRLHITQSWDELPTEVRESVQRGMEQARNGETKEHSVMVEKYGKMNFKAYQFDL